MFLHILGNLTVNGTLKMTDRGSKGVGQYVGIDPYKAKIELSDSDITSDYFYTIHPVGGLGIPNGSSPGANGACGSGGGESQGKYRGGNGTSFSGGTGAGGWVMKNNVYYYGRYQNEFFTDEQIRGQDDGGAGGYNWHYVSAPYWRVWSGGGAGNPGASAPKNVDHGYGKGTNGTGGLLILIVEGDITVNGSIQSNGSAGGPAGYDTGTNGYYRCGGCGSGGGAIHIFHAGSITGVDKITATGGAGGTGTSYGVAGGNGTINIVKI